MTESYRKPFWKRKRWIAAGVIWLVLPIAYPLSLGPVSYLGVQGWLPSSLLNAYGPAIRIQQYPLVGERYSDYLGWFIILGQKHQAAHKEDLPNGENSSTRRGD